MRTGTSTCTSRNGRIRMRRMYWSRPMRLAARSNWLSTIDLPDIVVRCVAGTGPGAGAAGLEPERPVVVTGPPVAISPTSGDDRRGGPRDVAPRAGGVPRGGDAGVAR